MKEIDDDWSHRFAVYGDMGNKNARSLSYLQQEAQRGHFDVVFHVGKSVSSFECKTQIEGNFLGDFAYDMDTVSARILPYKVRQKYCNYLFSTHPPSNC